jgi:hypothetical protein
MDARNLEDQRPRIEAAVKAVRKQIERSRRNDWWAWADLGMFLLLIGNEMEAMKVYRTFTEKGPQKKHFESAIKTLKTLETALNEIGSLLTASFGCAIAFLEQKKASI